MFPGCVRLLATSDGASVASADLVLELAERDYGVVIDPQTMEVDLEATQQLRAKRTAVPA